MSVVPWKLKSKVPTGKFPIKIPFPHVVLTPNYRHKYFKRPIIPVLNTVPPEM